MTHDKELFRKLSLQKFQKLR